MGVNIKKKNASNIYYGKKADSGALAHISEVQGGIQCNCICFACGQPLEAKKGSIRCHHFAHVSNYNCMYASEVALYQAVANILEQSGQIAIPPVTIIFPSWLSERTLHPEKIIHVDSVNFFCEALQYPPTLILSSGEQQLRILLEFGHYYQKHDYQTIALEAKEAGQSCLLFQFPDVSNDDYFTPGNLKTEISTLQAMTKKLWIFSCLEEQWKLRYYSATTAPVPLGAGHECPIHTASYDGQYCAKPADCAHCKFNVALSPDCRCLAFSGILDPADFKRSKEERDEEIATIRLKNEQQIEEDLRRAAFFAKCHTLHSAQNRPKAQPTAQESHQEYLRISASFNPDSEEITLDKFGQRWIQCEQCGAIRLEEDVIDHGENGVNRGICRDCSRKMR